MFNNFLLGNVLANYSPKKKKKKVLETRKENNMQVQITSFCSMLKEKGLRPRCILI